MSAQTFLAKIGLRIGVIGSALNLAVAAPLADGDLSMEAHTDVLRTGMHFANRDIAVVVKGTDALTITDTEVDFVQGVITSGKGGIASDVVLSAPGVTLQVQYSNPGGSDTLWNNAGTVYFGATPLVAGSVPWGSITGTLGNQTDLALALAGKETAGAAATVQGNLDTHTGLTTTAHGGIVASTDPRLANARTPTAHAASHAPGAADTVFPANAVGYLYNNGAGILSWEPAGTGSIGGSIAATQIAYGSGTKTIAGSNNFIYDSTHGRVGLGTSTPEAELHVKITPVSTIGVIIQGTVGQSDSLMEWRSSDGVTILSSISVIGYFRAPFGTAGAPGLSFQGDTDIGIFRPAANTVSISTSGIERMRVYPDGGVDIGGTYAASPGAAALRCAGSVQCVRATITAPGGASSALGVLNISSHNGPLFTAYDTSGGALVNITNGGLVSIGADLIATANLHIKPFVATRTGAIIQGTAAQSANLQEWQDNGGIILASISPAGAVTSSTFFMNTPQSVTASATITSGRVKFTGSTPAQTLTLPAGVAGTDIFIRNAATVSVTVARAGADTIEGATTFVLDPGEAISLTFIGTDWTIF